MEIQDGYPDSARLVLVSMLMQPFTINSTLARVLPGSIILSTVESRVKKI